MRDRTAVFMVLGAAVLWGTTGTARALAPAGASPLAVGAVRIAIGGAALMTIALARGSLRRGAWPVVPSLVAAAAVAAGELHADIPGEKLRGGLGPARSTSSTIFSITSIHS